MNGSTSTVTIHMVASLDGFIAKQDNDISWMRSSDQFEKGITLTDEVVAAFLEKIDCYIMGARTYEYAQELGWPYGEVPVKVLTHRDLAQTRPSVEFCSGDLAQLLNDRLKPQFNQIWMVGGAMLTKEFLRLQLADEIIIAIMPIILGEGVLFFDFIGIQQHLHLKDVTAYQDGMVELTYEILKH